MRPDLIIPIGSAAESFFYWYKVENKQSFQNDEKDKTRYTNVNLGRKWTKNHRIGPDAFLQLSFQFAAATHYGYHVNHYEAGSMARFYKGRTETIRPLTDEVQQAFIYLTKCVNGPSTIISTSKIA